MPRDPLLQAADRVREVIRDSARRVAPQPERFRVSAAAPLELTGVETDTLLDERDEDVEVLDAVRGATLAVGDIVWVQPVASPDGDTVQQWLVHSVGESAAGSSGGGPVTTQTFDQSVPANPWVIDHGLGRYPVGIETFDTSGIKVEGDVVNTTMTTTISFSGVMSGKATYI